MLAGHIHGPSCSLMVSVVPPAPDPTSQGAACFLGVSTTCPCPHLPSVGPSGSQGFSLYASLYLVWGGGAPGPFGGRQVSLAARPASKTGHVSTCVRLRHRVAVPLTPEPPAPCAPTSLAPEPPLLCSRCLDCTPPLDPGRVCGPAAQEAGPAPLSGWVQTLWPRCGARSGPFSPFLFLAGSWPSAPACSSAS